MNPLDELLAELRGRVTDPAKQQLVVQIAADLTRLHSLELLGQDVTKELRHVHAQAKLLGATEALAVQAVFTDWVTKLATGLVTAAVSGAIAKS